MKKLKIISIFIFIIISIGNIYAEIVDEKKVSESITDSMSNTYQLDEFVTTMNDELKKNGMDEINLDDITEELMKSDNANYSNIVTKVLSMFGKEIMSALKGSILIFIIVIIMGVLSSLELESKSDITKIAHLVCFVVLATITIATFVDTISIFKNVVGSITTIMQTISPFLMTVLIAGGAITSTGMIQPMLLFVSGAIGFVINYVVIPFLSISVAFNVICSISENLKLNKISALFSKSAIWIVGVMLTLFLGVLSLESSITSSVDSLAVKTTQTAVSNFVPVVGKFFSDSFETVVGATKIVSKVGGTVGIIAILAIAIVPIIKILSIMVIYYILAALIEPITSDSTVGKYITGFANVYKNLLGILIGVAILFIISTGIVLNLVSTIVK